MPGGQDGSRGEAGVASLALVRQEEAWGQERETQLLGPVANFKAGSGQLRATAVPTWKGGNKVGSGKDTGGTLSLGCVYTQTARESHTKWHGKPN